jgi:glycosyltransferase involved in cell wall biosynthesis
MDKIAFCIPSKSNLRYLKGCIESIRRNAYRKDHEIIVFVDQDTDGTIEWLKENHTKYNIKWSVNPNMFEVYGIGRAYDECISLASTDIVLIFHADMILGTDADLHAFKHLQRVKWRVLLA